MPGPTEECRACAQILVQIPAVLFACRVTLAKSLDRASSGKQGWSSHPSWGCYDRSPRPGGFRGGVAGPCEVKALLGHMARGPSHPNKRPNLTQPQPPPLRLEHNTAGLWPASADQISSNIPARLPRPADKGLFVANIFFKSLNILAVKGRSHCKTVQKFGEEPVSNVRVSPETESASCFF